jgi:hypothetical protein
MYVIIEKPDNRSDLERRLKKSKEWKREVQVQLSREHFDRD